MEIKRIHHWCPVGTGKVRHTRSNVSCTKTFLKTTMIEVCFFPQFKMFSSLEFRLSVVVAWLEPGLQYHEAVDLARNVRTMSRAFLILYKQPSHQCQIRVLAIPDRVCTQSTNSWIFRSFQQRYVEKEHYSTQPTIGRTLNARIVFHSSTIANIWNFDIPHACFIIDAAFIRCFVRPLHMVLLEMGAKCHGANPERGRTGTPSIFQNMDISNGKICSTSPGLKLDPPWSEVGPPPPPPEKYSLIEAGTEDRLARLSCLIWLLFTLDANSIFLTRSTFSDS